MELTKIIYTRKDIMELLQIHQITLWRWMKKGVFPMPDLKISDRDAFWSKQTLETFFKSQK